MDFNCILIRYGELALKGKNKSVFEQRLKKNILHKLNKYNIRVTKSHGRMFVELGSNNKNEEILESLKKILGIAGFSLAFRIESEVDKMKEVIDKLLIYNKEYEHSTFKVISRRANKQFPISSNDLNMMLGSYILDKNPQLKVDVHRPMLKICVEIREYSTYIYANDIKGLGGLPVGSSGKATLLLSGGIDSPVAGYLALKRGIELSSVHFHSYPYTSPRSEKKVVDLGKILTKFSGPKKLFVVPFTDIQLEINKHCVRSYSIIVMRMLMVRIAQKLALLEGSKALYTGESLGQVASQTLESINCTNSVSELPILRPLIGMDKHDIISIAQEIGTYETSILPYEDCCTVFLPEAPKTKPNLRAARSQEERLDVTQLVDDAVNNTKLVRLSEDI